MFCMATNLHFLFLFILFHCHHCHASHPHNISFWTTQHNDQFGIEATEPTAPMPVRMLIVTLSGRHRRLPGYPTYSYTGHNSQQPHNVCHTLWPKWPTAAIMVPHSQRRCSQWSPSMLADCCMQQRREWGTMAAAGWRRPPRSAGHSLASFS